MTPQPVRVAHYQITAKLGEGGMGAVYRATDTKLNREVAIKILPDALAADPDYLARFTREAQVLASLNHPHIAAIYGIEDRAIVMELVEGRDLPTPLPLDEALPIARQIADALEAAHEKGIVHRDLKPANIKLTPGGKAKVLDFGLAKAAEPVVSTAPNSPTLTLRATQAGVIMGTAAYMAPEQARGKVVDKRADIWAFGVVLYEMLTGRQLFGGDTVTDILASVVKDSPDLNALPDGTPPHIRRLLSRCLQKDPARRLRDIGEARIALDEPIEAPAPMSPIIQKRPYVWIAACAVLALALAGVLSQFPRDTPTPPPIRFQVLAPEGGALSTGSLAMSPDGRKLVFSATGIGFGRPLLWVRALESLELHPLPGTENAVFPFWSPDSRFVAFWANNRLSRVEASGGPVQTICNTGKVFSGGNAAGSWTADGTIYFSGGGSGIFRVLQSGGDPVLVGKADPSRGERYFFFPIALPDKKGFLFHNQVAERENNSINFAPLDFNQSTRLATSMYRFDYAPPRRRGAPGHLLYIRQNTLIAQPVDPDTFSTVGDVFPVQENVGVNNASARFSISASGALAYRPKEAAAPRELVWYDRAGNALANAGQPAEYDHVAISRDGARVAAAQFDSQTGHRDIWLLDPVRDASMRVSFERSDNNLPVWSPDGSHIAFSSRSSGPYHIFLKPSNGAGAEDEMPAAKSTATVCDWSDDGRWLLFTDGARGGLQLWTVEEPSDPQRRKTAPYLDTPYNTNRAQFAPTARGVAPRWVAYESDESNRGTEIYVQSFPSGNGKYLISNGGGSQPRWRRDGKELFYLSPDGKLVSVDVDTGASFKAGRPRPLFATRSTDNIPGANVTSYRYDVAPDGKRFLFNCPRETKSGGPPPSIVVVTDWLAGVKK